MDIEKRVDKLEEKLNAITEILTESKNKEVDVMGEKNVKQIFGTVRIKNVKLIFPIITDADVESRESKGSAVESRTTLIAIEDTKENIEAIENAFKSAIEYGIQGGILTPDMTPTKVIKDLGQNPFVTDINSWIEKLPGDQSFMKNALDGRRLLKNCKVSVDEDKGTVVLDNQGKPFSQNKKVQMGATAEVTINFAAYKYMNKRGVGRYIQGIKIENNMDENSPYSLYF